MMLQPAELETRRAEADISVEALCAAAKVAPSTYYRWITPGRSSPTMRTLDRVNQALDALIEERLAAVEHRHAS